jgi:outer membrane protein OmpA-like peptidoglycan-associated protein
MLGSLAMRRAPLLLALALPLAAVTALPPAPARADAPLPMDAAKSKLALTIDRSKVDIPAGRLEVKLNHACEKVRLKVIGETGAVLAEVEQKFGGAAAGTALEVTWTTASTEAVARIEVWGHDTDGFYAGIAIVPWSVSIEHEEVNFETNSDTIRASEVPKLQASLDQIREILKKRAELGQITLFVVGHTDTVGSPESNLALSRKRARSIAAWFRAQGLSGPIAFEGLGESSPVVKSGDEKDEPKNRRVDYILALEPPTLPAGVAGAGWKGL